MMDILDNALVQKYFGCLASEPVACYDSGARKHRDGVDCRAYTAEQVMRAMQEPIQEGESYLQISTNDGKAELREMNWAAPLYNRPHFYELRLPDKLQKRKFTMTVRISDRFCTHEFKYAHEGKASIKDLANCIQKRLDADAYTSELVEPYHGKGI